MKQPKKRKMEDRFVESLLPEDDVKVTQKIGLASVIAIAFAFWASTITFQIIDPIFKQNYDDHPDMKATFKINEMPDKKPKPKPKLKNQKANGGKMGTKGASSVSKPLKPKANTMFGRTALQLLKSRTPGALSAKNWMGASLAVDIKKVLSQTNRLVKDGATHIGAGTRRSAVDVGFKLNGSFGGKEKGSGIGNSISEILSRGPGSGGRLGNKSLKVAIPKPSSITMGNGSAVRSRNSIMRVIRSRTPGLRHIYNKFLKYNPGFAGKVSLRFTIAPSGKIIKISHVSSTTGVALFDAAIKNKVKHWNFNKIKSGNTVITVPFTFTE